MSKTNYTGSLLDKLFGDGRRFVDLSEEEKTLYRRELYKSRKEERRLWNKSWYDRYGKSYYKMYRERNKEKIREYNNRWRRENPDKIKEYRSKDYSGRKSEGSKENTK